MNTIIYTHLNAEIRKGGNHILTVILTSRPHPHPHLNTQVAEQIFSYFSKFKHSFKGYNYSKSTIFFLLLFHLKNCVTTGLNSFEQAV